MSTRAKIPLIGLEIISCLSFGGNNAVPVIQINWASVVKTQSIVDAVSFQEHIKTRQQAITILFLSVGSSLMLLMRFESCKFIEFVW